MHLFCTVFIYTIIAGLPRKLKVFKSLYFAFYRFKVLNLLKFLFEVFIKGIIYVMQIKVSFSRKQIFSHIRSNFNGPFSSFTFLNTIALTALHNSESTVVDQGPVLRNPISANPGLRF